jgi:hypothetical protein
MVQYCPLENTGLENQTVRAVQLKNYTAVELQATPFAPYELHTDHDTRLSSSIPAILQDSTEMQVMPYVPFQMNIEISGLLELHTGLAELGFELEIQTV